MEKIAVLILAHKNLEQIRILISQFDSKFYDLFIHVDSKCDFEPSVLNSNNVFVLKKRINCKWGSFSLVEAEIELLKFAFKKTDNKYFYYRLISGQDLLIKRSSEAYLFLKSNYGSNFFKVFNTDLNRFKKRNEIFYPQFLIGNKLNTRILRNIYLIMTGGKRRTFNFLKRTFSKNWNFLFSSQWFTITDKAVEYILKFITRNNYVISEFKKSICPDECFFSTIVFNSIFKNTINCDNLLYVDFSNYKSSPKTLLDSDFDKIMNSKYFIARKFDMDTDYLIIEKIIKFLSATV